MAYSCYFHFRCVKRSYVVFVPFLSRNHEKVEDDPIQSLCKRVVSNFHDKRLKFKDEDDVDRYELLKQEGIVLIVYLRRCNFHWVEEDV